MASSSGPTVLITTVLLLSAMYLAWTRERVDETSCSTGTAIAVNGASAEDLCLLPGVGPRLARRMVESRTERGQFETIEDLRRVKGLGPRTVERLAPFVRLDRGER